MKVEDYETPDGREEEEKERRRKRKEEEKEEDFRTLKIRNSKVSNIELEDQKRNVWCSNKP